MQQSRRCAGPKHACGHDSRRGAVQLSAADDPWAVTILLTVFPAGLKHSSAHRGGACGDEGGCLVHGRAGQPAPGVCAQSFPHPPRLGPPRGGAPHHAQVAQVDASIRASSHRLVRPGPRLRCQADLHSRRHSSGWLRQHQRFVHVRDCTVSGMRRLHRWPPSGPAATAWCGLAPGSAARLTCAAVCTHKLVWVRAWADSEFHSGPRLTQQPC